MVIAIATADKAMIDGETRLFTTDLYATDDITLRHSLHLAV